MKLEDGLLAILVRRRATPLADLVGAALTVAIATALQLILWTTSHSFPFLLYYPTAFLCALVFDRRAAMFATLLCAAIATYAFVAPHWTFELGITGAVAVGIFLLAGFLFANFADLLRRTVAHVHESEATKALLLEELAHRTKNDLAIVSAAITLQSHASDNPEVRAALSAANARVMVIAQAQERLRIDDDRGQIELAPYVRDLCDGLANLLRDVRPIAVRVACDPLVVPGRVAARVGLIVNELVTNSLKYAYPDDRGGTIEVTVSGGPPLTIAVADDGIGYPEDGRTGLGTRLVRLLAREMNGTVEREPSAAGCRVAVTLDLAA